MSAGCWIAASVLALAACGETGDNGSDDNSGTSSATQTPPPGPAGSGDILATEEASRFLSQATFGPTQAEIDNLVTVGASAWLQAEFAKTAGIAVAGGFAGGSRR